MSTAEAIAGALDSIHSLWQHIGNPRGVEILDRVVIHLWKDFSAALNAGDSAP